MSLVITLSSGGKLCVAADSRAVSTLTGPEPRPVEKIRVIEHFQSHSIVAVAGEAEIDGIKLLDHASTHSHLLSDVSGILQFRDVLNEAWKRDVESYSWDDLSDKESYISAARITLLVAPNAGGLFVINGKYEDLKVQEYPPAQSLIAFGMPDLVKAGLECEPEKTSEWPQYLVSLFSEAAVKSNFVAAPISVCLRESSLTPVVQRYSLAELNELKIQ